MKIKYKLILDILMAIAFILCMSYNFTGGPVHEYLGFALIGAFVAHIAINRKYYGAMTKSIFNGKVKGLKHKAAYVINVILVVSMGLMLISSMAISQVVMPGVSDLVGAYGVWRTIHIVSAVVMSLCLLAHVVMHFSMFEKLIKKVSGRKLAVGTWRLASGVAAIMLTVVALKTDIGYMQTSFALPEQRTTSTSESLENTPTSGIIPEENGQLEEDFSAGNEKSDEALPNQSVSDSVDGDVPSLSEYLGGLFCTACGKHCSLLAPQCGRGNRQVEEATETYNSIYAA